MYYQPPSYNYSVQDYGRQSSYVNVVTIDNYGGRRRPDFNDPYNYNIARNYILDIPELKDNLGLGGAKNSKTFRFDDIILEKSKEYGCDQEFILTTQVEGYKMFDPVCKMTFEALKRKTKRSDLGVLYSSILLDNSDMIGRIKNNQQGYGEYTKASVISSYIHNNILTLANEFIELTEKFENDVIGKISVDKVSESEIAKLKNYVNTLEFDRENHPNLRDIGTKPDLMKGYLKLAIFFTRFTGFSSSTDRRGISENLRCHIVRLVQLRKLIVTRITDYLKYICKDVYEFIFSLEGMPADRDFLKSIPVEYVVEDPEIRIRLEEELRKKDEIIRRLQEELDQKSKHLVQSSDLERTIHILQQTNSSLQIEIKRLNVIIENIQIENNNYITEINSFKQRIVIIENDITNKYTIIINKMKEDWERQVISIREEVSREREFYWKQQIVIVENEWRRKYDEINISYQKIQVEINQLRIQINVYINEIDDWRRKHDSLVEVKNKVEYIEKTVVKVVLRDVVQVRKEIVNITKVLTEVQKVPFKVMEVRELPPVVHSEPPRIIKEPYPVIRVVEVIKKEIETKIVKESYPVVKVVLRDVIQVRKEIVKESYPVVKVVEVNLILYIFI